MESETAGGGGVNTRCPLVLFHALLMWQWNILTTCNETICFKNSIPYENRHNNPNQTLEPDIRCANYNIDFVSFGVIYSVGPIRNNVMYTLSLCRQHIIIS